MSREIHGNFLPFCNVCCCCLLFPPVHYLSPGGPVTAGNLWCASSFGHLSFWIFSGFFCMIVAVWWLQVSVWLDVYFLTFWRNWHVRKNKESFGQILSTALSNPQICGVSTAGHPHASSAWLLVSRAEKNMAICEGILWLETAKVGICSAVVSYLQIIPFSCFVQGSWKEKKHIQEAQGMILASRNSFVTISFSDGIGNSWKETTSRPSPKVVIHSFPRITAQMGSWNICTGNMPPFTPLTQTVQFIICLVIFLNSGLVSKIPTPSLTILLPILADARTGEKLSSTENCRVRWQGSPKCSGSTS